MSVFVVLAWAIAIFLAALLVVVIRQLVRAVRGLTAGVKTAAERIVPLTADLSSEVATTSLEMAAITRSLERGRAERAQRHRQRPRPVRRRKRR